MGNQQSVKCGLLILRQSINQQLPAMRNKVDELTLSYCFLSLFSMKQCPETNYFFNTQDPINQPPNIKTLDLRVQNSFDLRVGNRDFRRTSRGNTKDFFIFNIKLGAKNYRVQVECSRFFQMKRNRKNIKVKQKLLGSETRLRYLEHFWTGGGPQAPPPAEDRGKQTICVVS